MIDWIQGILRLNVDLIARGGYAGVFLLMAIESSFIPFPSEVVVPPAGFLAAQGKLSGIGVMAAALLGSLAGAFVNYGLAVKVGRPFFHRWGKWFLVSAKGLDRAEAFFMRHGEIGTFAGRLVPGVRQLISIPAGMARMHLGRFAFFTALGAGIWCGILFGIGWSIGKAGDRLDLTEVKKAAIHDFLVWVLPALLVIVATYVLWRRLRPAPPPPPPPPAGD